MGDWLPEPLPEPRSGQAGRHDSGSIVAPADRVTLDESINMAFLVVLESMMIPAERVASILRDVFRWTDWCTTRLPWTSTPASRVFRT